jgi:HSP20 family molecular chaperone IbpA
MSSAQQSDSILRHEIAEGMGHVVASKVNAEFKDGLLKVQVAKSETARPKQIEVS